MTPEAVHTLVCNALREVAPHLATLSSAPDRPLYGAEGGLNSILLVTFIATIEDMLADVLHAPIALADDRALSLQRSPFRTLATVVAHVTTLVAQHANAAEVGHD